MEGKTVLQILPFPTSEIFFSFQVFSVVKSLWGRILL